ncbi:MAG: hypothetical protein JWM73_1632 [Solirubrobacterales bacterium]|nr:hypothetical protein [Solirubrobacterales bacterium]
MAGAQSGVVSRRQLVERGVTRHQIDRRLESGHLHLLYRGVYAVGHRALVARSRRWAALLALGPGATLSHRTAADELGLRRDDRFTVDVTAPRRARGRRGLIAHQAQLDDPDRVEIDGLWVTSWPRTLLDLAAERRVTEVVRALEQADKLDLLDVRALDAVCARARGHHGERTLRRACERYDPRHGRTRSPLERDALSLVAAAGLPRPEINAVIGPLTVDLHWPEHGVVLELDSWEHHRTRGAFERDRARDRYLATRGLVGLRMTWRQLHAGGLADVARVLENAGGAPSPAQRR